MTRKNRFFYRLLYGFFRFVSFLGLPVRAVGTENIPEGAAVFCANHTTAADPVLLGVALGHKHFVHFLAKEQARSIPVLGKLMENAGIIFAKRDGKDYDSIRACLKALDNNEPLMLFPEGTRVRPGMTVVPQNGAVHIASRKGVPLVPVYIPPEKKLFHRITIRFGEPYVVPKTMGEALNERTAELMERIAALGEEK